MEKSVAIQLQGLTKVFGSVVANNHVSLDIYKGEILSILGENGCGKTTLMNMIAGIYYPDDGDILIDGKKVKINSPRDAYNFKIGMIHQHFKLVDVFSAVDNIILGEDLKFNNEDKKSAKTKIKKWFNFNFLAKNRGKEKPFRDFC